MCVQSRVSRKNIFPLNFLSRVKAEVTFPRIVLSFLSSPFFLLPSSSLENFLSLSLSFSFTHSLTHSSSFRERDVVPCPQGFLRKVAYFRVPRLGLAFPFEFILLPPNASGFPFSTGRSRSDYHDILATLLCLLASNFHNAPFLCLIDASGRSDGIA